MTFQKGQSGNPAGKLPGTKNKTTKALREQILESLDREGGIAYLQWLSRNNSSAYAALLGRVLPTTLAGGEEDGKMGMRVVFERRIVMPDGSKVVEITGGDSQNEPKALPKNLPELGARAAPVTDETDGIEPQVIDIADHSDDGA